VVASKADTDVVRAGFHPRVDASAGLSQIDQTVLNYPPTTTHSSVFGYNYDISARMPVLHLPTYHYLSSATAAMRGEAAGASAAQQNLIVKLADAYFSLLKARTDEQIARDELARLKQILDQAQAFLKAGTGDIISVFEAQARRDGVTADLNHAPVGRAETGRHRQKAGDCNGRLSAVAADGAGTRRPGLVADDHGKAGPPDSAGARRAHPDTGADEGRKSRALSCR
jgi:outer membrane protein